MPPTSAIIAFETARDLLWQEQFELSGASTQLCDWPKLEALLDESQAMRKAFCQNWGLSFTSTIEQQLADMRWASR